MSQETYMVTPQTNNLVLGIAYAFATALVGSTAGAANKYISGSVPVPAIVLIQYTICLAVMIPWLVHQSRLTLSTHRWGAHLVRGLSGWLCFYTYYTALKQIPLVEASLFRNTAPLFVPLVAWLWLGALVPTKHWLPLLLGFIGIALILQPGATEVSSDHLLGLLSGVTLAISMVGTRTLSQTDSGNLILFYYIVIALICSLPLGIYHWQPIPLWTWPFLAYIGLSFFLAMWLYTRAYSYAKPSVVSPISYFSVAMSGLLGWLIWQHIPSGIAFVGIALVIATAVATLYLGSTQDKQIQAGVSPQHSCNKLGN